MRTVWVHKLDVLKPVDTLNVLVDTCAICRGILLSPCRNCDSTDQVKADRKRVYDTVKGIWLSLLCLSKRKECVFNRLDKPVVYRIYGFVIANLDWAVKDTQFSCHVIKLACNHTFHRHCFQTWVVRRQTCPLCTQAEVVPIAVSSIQFSARGEVMSIYNSEKTFVSVARQKREQQRLEYVVQSWIMRFLKEVIPGRTMEEIQAKASSFKFPLDLVDSMLAVLVQREFVHIVGDKFVHDCHHKE
jgi:hypothetical protein